jgi:hypothetical protein
MLLRLSFFACALALLVPAAASAKLRFTSLGSTVGVAQTDARYAAWPLGDGTIKVLDTRTGAVRDIAAAPAGCRFADLGGGRLLWSCGPGERQHGRVLDIATGALAEVAPPDTASAFAWLAVGRNWAQAVASGYRYGGVVDYVDLATTEEQADSSSSPSTFPDMDAPGLAVTMCDPLARTRDPNYVPGDSQTYGEAFFPFIYAPPYGLTVNPGNSDPARTAPKTLTLSTCSSTRTRTLSRKADAYDFRTGLAAWTQTGGSALHLYDAAKNRPAIWHPPRGRTTAAVALTSRYVVITEQSHRARRVLIAARPR